MTETEWLVCKDPTPMIRFMLGEPILETIEDDGHPPFDIERFPQCRGTDRQRRHLLCACCRVIDPDLATSACFREAVEITEGHFGGTTSVIEAVKVAGRLYTEINEEQAIRNAPPPAPSQRSWKSALAEIVGRTFGLQARRSLPGNRTPEQWRNLMLLNLGAYTAELNDESRGIIGIDWISRDFFTSLVPEAYRRVWCDRVPTLVRDIFGNPFRSVTFSPAWCTSTAVALASQMYESRDFSAMPILADALQDAGCDNEDVLDHGRGPGPHVRGCWVVDLVLGKT